MDFKPKVSIIIPVYNEEDILRECLNSLMKLRYPKDLLEIIVIDNNSTDSSADIIRRYPVKYLFEKECGRGPAKNAGIKASTGEIIAFADADCVVGKNWIKNIVKEFENKSVGCCGGRTLSYRPENWMEKILYYSQKYQYKSGEFDDFSNGESYFTEPIYATCNIACRKEVFGKIGMFDGIFLAGEDAEWLWRMNLGGYAIKHAPKAVVFHKHRNKLSQMPEIFGNYLYWQFWLVERYKDIIGLSYNWPRITADIFTNYFYAVVNLFNAKEKGKSVFYFARAIFSLAGLLGGAYGKLQIFFGRGKIFNPLIFVPSKIIWRWDKNNNIKILDLANQNCYLLAGVSARIWEFYINGKEDDEIVESLAENFSGDKQEIRNDVSCFLKEFKQFTI